MDMKNNRIIESFAEVSKCGIMGFDDNGNIILSINSCSCSCCVAKKSPKINEVEKYCGAIHCHSGKQSEIFGGKYIYYCPSGLIFIACLISEENESSKKYMVAGPISPLEYCEFDIEELAVSCEINAEDEELHEFIKSVPFFSSASVSNIANLFYFFISHLSESKSTDVPKNSKNNEIYEQQREISEYIQDMKASLIKEHQSYISYPYDKEKQLVYAIITNDLASSRKYLNEILGHIFFSSANDLDFIKVRAMELSVMISRAALDAGADQLNIFDINMKFLSEFFNYKTIEEVCWALTDILRKFTKEAFEFSNVKNIDLISRAVSYIKSNYIKSNYSRKITLDEVAAYVFLSPSYFSKIFKREMGFYFNDYLNYVRVQKSKFLLLTEHMRLVDVADFVGFYDQSYFNKIFKKLTGMTPKKFKESNGKIPTEKI